ncbi:permease prefix domain 1-containing protein [Amycolatopsis roodepoortensis]|uniref:permease prefix domain 1-containing protein n=1 Tax=Amycolatopsis roodepoortensis TaxID=700274 RepID=UPI00214CD7D6|nr:permease prefix domain 1-containing protein [Amycolatopsis roodepoortensis]UUV35193.1 permease prefix domain 1-containing protein [Amycolatopsis roodepoortensis]
MNAIEAYIGELDAQLSGPRSAKADLLTEARDGLVDAADAYRAGGVDEAEAERRAVADFGPADLIARDYQAELGLRRDIRVLWELIAGVPLLILAWDLARGFADWSALGAVPSWYHRAIGTADTLAASSPAVAIAGLLAARLLSRRTAGPRVARAVSWTLAAAVGLNLVAVATYGGATGLLEPARMLVSVPCAALSGIWILFSMRLTVAARSWRTTA